MKAKLTQGLIKKILNGSPIKSYTQPDRILDKSGGGVLGGVAEGVSDAVTDKIEKDKKKKAKAGEDTDDTNNGTDDNGTDNTDANPPIQMKKSPAMRKLSASCKAAARAKFDVYPSAYANMWASKQQGKGKC